LDAIQAFLRRTPLIRSLNFEVRNVYLHASALTDGYSFLNGCFSPRPLVSQMRNVEAATFADNLGEFHQLISLGERPGNVFKPSRQSESAVTHPCPRQGLHHVELLWTGCG